MQRVGRRCPGLDLARLVALGGAEEEGATVKVRGAGDGVLVEWKQSAGEDSRFFETRWYVHDGRACQSTIVTSFATGVMWKYVLVEPEVTAPFGSRSPLHSLLGDWPDCSDPRHGFSCMYVRAHEHPCPNALQPSGRRWDLVPLFDLAGPWLAGPPTRQAATYWTRDEMGRARGARLPHEAGAIQGYSLPPLAAPKRVGVVDGRYRLFQTAHLPAAGPGFAFAVEDTRTRQHRWVGHTRACLLADEVEWLLAGDDLAIGHALYIPREPTRVGIDGLFVVDLREGPIYRLVVADLYALLGVDPAQPALRQDRSFGDEGRAGVTLAEGRLRLANDLEISTGELRARVAELAAMP